MCTRLWNADIKFSCTCLYDLGEAGSIVLNEREKHYLAQHQTVSTTKPESTREQDEQAGRILGRQVKVEVMPLEVTMGAEAAKIFGLPTHPYTQDAARRLVLYYNHHGLRGSNNVTRWILRREPMSFEEWLQSKLAYLKGEHYDLREARKA